MTDAQHPLSPIAKVEEPYGRRQLQSALDLIWTKLVALESRTAAVEGGSADAERSQVSVSAAYTVADGVDTVLADTSGGGFTVTLPTSSAGSTVPTGRQVAIKKDDSGSNTLTVAAGGSGTVDGAASVALDDAWEGGIFEHTGSNVWRIIATEDVGFAGPASAVDGDVAVFDGTTGALIKDSGVSVADLDNTQHVLLDEHFVPQSLTSGSVDLYNWTVDIGSLGTTAHPALAGHWSTLRLNSGTSGGDHAAIYLDTAVTGGTIALSTDGSANVLTFEAWVKLSSVTSTITEAWVGLGNQARWVTNATPGSGIYLGFDKNTSANWILRTHDGSTAVMRAGTTAVVAGTWYRIGFKYTDAGSGTYSIQLYVDGAAEGAAVTTNATLTSLTIGAVSVKDAAGGDNLSFDLERIRILQDVG